VQRSEPSCRANWRRREREREREKFYEGEIFHQKREHVAVKREQNFLLFVFLLFIQRVFVGLVVEVVLAALRHLA